jgi:hypothetical protein
MRGGLRGKYAIKAAKCQFGFSICFREEASLVVLAFCFAQTDPRPATVFWDELDPCPLQDELNGLKVVRYRNRSSSFEISDCTFANLGLGGQFCLRKLDQGARGAALSGCHLAPLQQITISAKDTG